MKQKPNFKQYGRSYTVVNFTDDMDDVIVIVNCFRKLLRFPLPAIQTSSLICLKLVDINEELNFYKFVYETSNELVAKCETNSTVVESIKSKVTIIFLKTKI